MKVLESQNFPSNLIKLAVCLTGTSLLVACSSPYKYTPRTSAQSQVEQQAVVAEVKPVSRQETPKSQAVQLNYYPSAELPKAEELSESSEATTQNDKGVSEAVNSEKTIKPISAAKTSAANPLSRFPCPSTYKVVSGDRLSNIAFRCRLELKALAQLNNIKAPYDLQIGQELMIPAFKAPVAASTAKTTTAVSNGVKELMGSKWQSPVTGSVPSKYIKDSNGLSVVEFYGVAGQRVNAVAPGKVVYSGNGIINFGWMVVIKHDDDFMSVYAHNSSVLVKEGDRVETGQFIATLGATGNTSKPKLYLEARFKGKKVDIHKVFN